MAVPILRSKFRVPVYAPVLRRDRLFARLDEAMNRPLTLVSAEAGYGKSAALATYLAERGHATLWLRLDELDRYADVLFAYLCAGLGDLVPSRQPSLLALASAVGQQLRSPAELAAELVAALGPPPAAPVTIVLDDFEVVQNSGEVTAALRQFILLQPERIRLVLLSRIRPADLSLPRLRLEERVAEITRADLAFTPAETLQLYTDVYGMPLAEGELQLLHGHCEGWPAGLRLVYEALHRAASPEEREHFWLNLLRAPDIFHYLWAEALASQPQDVQDFLLRTSILATLEPSITDVLLGITRSRQLLGQLARTGLFTCAEDSRGQSYRYHNLFRSFLRHRLEERGDAEALRHLHRRAAALYEQGSRHSHAIAHYMAARDYVNAARVISKVTDLYPPHTLSQLFDSWLEQHTPDARGAFPRLFMRRVLSLGALERLTALFREMLAEAAATGDLLRQAHAHERLALMPVCRNDAATALYHYGHAMVLFRELRDPAMEALILNQMGYLHWSKGDLAQARALYEQALALSQRHELNLPRLQSLVWLAQIALGAGELERAGQLARAAVQVAGQEEEFGARTYLTSLLAAVAGARGDHDRAIELADQALAFGELSGVRMDHGWGALAAGTTRLLAGDAQGAQPLLEQAVRLLTGHLVLQEVIARARLAAACARVGDEERARDCLGQALDTGRAHHLDYILRSELEAFPELRALALGRHLESASAAPAPPVLPASSTPPAVFTLASAPPSRLEFQTLGRFEVRCGTSDLTSELKRRRNCRRILLFLLAHRSRAVPRDEITETLWPDSPPDSGANSFNAALSGLRRLLEPHLTSGRDSHLIQREEDRYRLADELCRVDADDYVALVAPLVHKRGRRRLSVREEQTLTHAIAMYGGDFLSEYGGEAFLDTGRTALREMQRLALLRLGDHCRLQRQADKALRYYQAALALDPCSEHVHRRVIFAHRLAGDRARAVRAWQECVALLKRELGVEPDPTTQVLVQRLLGVRPEEAVQWPISSR